MASFSPAEPLQEQHSDVCYDAVKAFSVLLARQGVLALCNPLPQGRIVNLR